MANTERTKNRNRRTGRFVHDFATLCKCGRPFGEHLAEPPYASLDDECERFEVAR